MSAKYIYIPEYRDIFPTLKVMESRGVTRYRRLILFFCLKFDDQLARPYRPTFASLMKYQTHDLGLQSFWYYLETGDELEREPQLPSIYVNSCDGIVEMVEGGFIGVSFGNIYGEANVYVITARERI